MSLGSTHVEPAWVILEPGIRSLEGGHYELTDETRTKLDEIADQFSRYLARGG